MALIGSKALQFFRRLKRHRRGTATHLGDKPHVVELIGTVKVMLDFYRDAKIDQLLLVHNVFVNTMTQKAVVSQLLPIQTIDKDELQERWDYIYEPRCRRIPRRHPDALHRVAGLSGRGGERRLRDGRAHGGDEVATDNAGKLIDELQLIYNKARQAAITKEICAPSGGPIGSTGWRPPFRRS